MIDLDLLIESQKPAVKSFFGGQHYNTIAKTLSDFKNLYEHKDWKLLANLGFLQIYSKPSEEQGTIHIFGRCEINHKVVDIANEISDQHILIKQDQNIIETEMMQEVGEDLHVYYAKFRKFLVANQSDLTIA